MAANPSTCRSFATISPALCFLTTDPFLKESHCHRFASLVFAIHVAYAARLKNTHIDCHVSGSGNAKTNDLVSGNCEEIRIAVTTASHTPDGPCATGRPNDGAYDGADGERGGAADGRGAAADGWRRLEP